jgi:hypothetical protein
MSQFEMNIISLLVLLGIAALNTYTAIINKNTNKTIEVLEKNTNSIKDALVASTAKASLAEGKAEGLKQGREEKTDKT